MVGVQLLWFCIILCYIWQNLAGLKPQLIIWFWKGREEYVRFAFPICPQDDGTCSLASPEQGNTIPINIYQNHLAALQSRDGEWDFGRPCLWIPALPCPAELLLSEPPVPMSPPWGQQPIQGPPVPGMSPPALPDLPSLGVPLSWPGATGNLPKCFLRLVGEVFSQLSLEILICWPAAGPGQGPVPWTFLWCRIVSGLDRWRHWNTGRFVGVLLWGFLFVFWINLLQSG